ncbi:hypothetical protein [Dongia rigui]|uniref:FlgN protein n=1 Tax=Dongia rigui TaxID=940149 RepID=A0ABU5DTP3_9PROT|nr:hypothetical protein [Dongia rigui]MDY0870699.1 hypothetical protein [Dongia rigui]
MTDKPETEPGSALEALKALLTREIEAVAANRIDTLRETARTKATITRTMRAEMGSALEELSERARTEDTPDFAGLRAELAELAALAERHRRTVASAIDATRERIGAVVDARRIAATTHETYGANARVRIGTSSRQSMMTSSTKI